MLCAEFLEANYDQVFTHYQQLLNSENYVTRRQSLKLLGELLLDRHNFSVIFGQFFVINRYFHTTFNANRSRMKLICFSFHPNCR